MNDFPKKQILINYLLGICTPGEQKEVEAWLDKEPGNVLLLQQMAHELNGENFLPLFEKEEVKQSLFRLIEQQDIREDDNPIRPAYRQDLRSSHSSLQLWLKAAAVILVAALAGLVSVYLGTDYISPVKEAETHLQQRSLSNGQMATFHFGDGSVIQLNGGSTLRYPKRFADNRREVYLEGEAFFSVKRDESRPFIVHTGEATTQVLGTSFNVKAYSSEDELQVVVAEGKVAVSHKNPEVPLSEGNDGTIILEKDQWVTYRSKGKLMEKGEGDIWEMIAWKDKVLIFNNKTFSEVARLLERWYSVEIDIESEKLKEVVLQGEHKDSSLEGVLKSIQYVTDMQYEMDGKNVRIWAERP